MAQRPAILTTRPAAQADRLLQPLQAAGYPVTNIPLLDIEPLELQPQQRQWLLDLDQYHKVVVISPSAARQLLEPLEDYWPQWPVGVDWFTVGAGTRSQLQQAGIDATCPTTGDRSEDLLALEPLQDLQGQRILLVKGEGGRPLLEQTLTERGARVDSLPLYRRIKPRLAPDQLRELVQGDYPLLVITSGEALEHYQEFLQQLTDETQRARLQQARWLLLPSPRLEQQARAFGFQQVYSTQGAGADAILGSIRTLLPMITT